MPSDVDIVIERNKGIIGSSSFGPLAVHELIKTVEDIGGLINKTASALAPEGPSGALKRHPADVSEVRAGILTNVASFGGGVSARGAGGRFTAGGISGGSGIGNAVVLMDITLPEFPREAVFVHQGTGLFGPRHDYITAKTPGKRMVFDAYGRHWRLLRVKGQQAQPYLLDAFKIVNDLFVPIEVEKLRAKLQLITI